MKGEVPEGSGCRDLARFGRVLAQIPGEVPEFPERFRRVPAQIP